MSVETVSHTTNYPPPPPYVYLPPPPQVEMCGSSIFDYIHSQDHAEFAEHTGLTLSNGRPLASPGEENAGPVGTHNPDGTPPSTAPRDRYCSL